MSKSDGSSKTGPACPICARPVDPGFRPFCSKRCADIDLQRWLSDRYVVPAVEDEEGPREDPSDED
jgi:endogenous inhibitor of DNA gyrase (YacG/DUF329 family)